MIPPEVWVIPGHMHNKGPHIHQQGLRHSRTLSFALLALSLDKSLIDRVIKVIQGYSVLLGLSGLS